MIHRLILLFVIAGCLISCQDSDVYSDISNNSEIDNDGVAVNFSFAFDSKITIDSEFEPMLKGGSITDPNKIATVIKNRYTVVVMKEVDNKWIIEGIDPIMPYSSRHRGFDIKYAPAMTGGDSFTSNSVTTSSIPALKKILRPGKYKISIFLNSDGYQFNELLERGQIIDILNPPRAIGYSQNNSLASGANSGVGELWFATLDFTVTKSEDLHSSPAPNHTLLFQRKVSKFRYALRMSQSGFDFQRYEKRTWINMSTADNNGFVTGIDLLGNPVYGDDNGNAVTTMVNYVINSYPNSLVTGNDNNEYFLSLEMGNSSFSPFLFGDSRNIEYNITRIFISDGDANWYEKYIYDASLSSPITKKMKDNDEIDGVILELDGGKTNSSGEYLMKVITDGSGKPEDPSVYFDPFVEIN